MSRRAFSDEGEPWDGAEWVDVGDDGHWRPSAVERTRAFVLLGGLIGILVLVAAVSSFGGGDEPEVSAASSTTTTSEPEQTTTTQPLPSSLDGEPAPEQCRADDRDAAALRDPSELRVSVLNGARVGGLAGDTSADLAALGYSAEPDDAEATVQTSISYAPGYCAEAVALADALRVPVPEIAEAAVEGDVHLVVMLGSDNYSD